MSDVESTSKTLQVTTTESVSRDLGLKPGTAALPATAGSDDLSQAADKIVADLLATNPKKVEEKSSASASVESMAAETQKQAARLSELLKEPIGKISKRGANDGDVGNSLIQLKSKVEELDPAKFNFEKGWLTKLVGKVPGVGDPIKRYFTKYESAQTVIKGITDSLERGRDQLLRDNQTLFDDQKEMWTVSEKLQKAIALAGAIDQRLASAAQAESDPGKKAFIENELLFALRQRTIDLQQQLAVTQQGIIAMELVVRNNKELARGVNRTLSVTMSALQVGVTVAIALERQKDVLDKVNAVSSTTSDLIAGTAARLKTQGAEIQKNASSATLNMESLKNAFADLNSALDDISKFRNQALPHMAQTVIELDKMTGDASRTLKSIEEAQKRSGDIKIEIT